MHIAGQTKLSQCNDVTADLRQNLHFMWIESIEEYVSLLAAAEASLVQQSLGDTPEHGRNIAANSLPFERREELFTPAAGGALGCAVDPEILNEFKKQGRLSHPRRQPPAAPMGPLPGKVRLNTRLQPVKNQAERGTCVAFASVALREFLADNNLELSEQFLYWACKDLAGDQGAGTFISTAIAALSKYGVCLNKTWPYNPRQAESEGQGPPPSEALEEAAEYKMLYSRPVEASWVEHYKQILAGDEDCPGMPVVFATLVFKSWYMSPETHRTGKITMPLPGELPESGGHAWCITGYVDDPQVPGGGYFIVRNSWGSDWASDSPEKSGHAMMPYAYVESYALEAFTGQPEDLIRGQKQPQPENDIKSYLRQLNSPARDMEGKKLKSGTWVLSHPLAPNEIMEDNDTNRALFRQQDCTWSNEARTRVWFPDAGPEVKEELREAGIAANQFMAALDENLIASRKMKVPELHLPWTTFLLPFYPWIRSVKRVADINDEMVAKIKEGSEVPSEISWPDEYTRLLRDNTNVRIYEIRGLFCLMRVVVAYVVPVTIFQGRGMSLQPGDSRTLQAVQDAYAEWAEKAHVKPSLMTFYSIAAPKPWPESLKAVTSKDTCFVFSHLQADGKWHTRIPEGFLDRQSVRDFIDRLKPETQRQRFARVKSYVDEQLENVTAGNISLQKVAKAISLRDKHVRNAFLALQSTGDYQLYWSGNEHRQLSIEKATEYSKPKIGEHSFRHSWLVRNVPIVLAAAVGAAPWFVMDALAGEPFDVRGFLAMIPFVYVALLIKKKLQKIAKD